MIKTVLIIPTLNEIDGCKAIMPQIDRSWCDEVIVVDGGSNDGTVEWLRANGWRVIIQEKRGLGNAYRQAQAATTGDVIITFSPDGNSRADRIPDLIAEMKKGYDMVIVSRYLDGAKSLDDDALTSWGNPLFTFMINTCFKGQYTDSLVIFRAYKRSILASLPIDAGHMTYEAQLSIRAAKARLKVGEIPGDEPKRIGGERKMSPFGTGFEILKEIGRNLVR
jgi:glycosyltransferase involved in cell wall biosynthesis